MYTTKDRQGGGHFGCSARAIGIDFQVTAGQTLELSGALAAAAADATTETAASAGE
jgi:hypothetical protein